MRWFCGLLGAMLMPLAASAHDLGAECTIEGEIVRVAVYYDDDTDAIGANVRVTDETNRTIARGETDDKGIWTFPRPPAGTYRIDIDAGAGHQRRVRLTVPAGSDETLATDQPSKAEFTRSRWPELILGLALIAAGAVGLAWFLRSRQRAAPTARSN